MFDKKLNDRTHRSILEHDDVRVSRWRAAVARAPTVFTKNRERLQNGEYLPGS
jgi:hypothetical protein